VLTPRLRDLFHPDCDRRPWFCTRSADPDTCNGLCQALAGSCSCLQIPPVGNSAPPWERCQPVGTDEDILGGQLVPAVTHAAPHARRRL